MSDGVRNGCNIAGTKNVIYSLLVYSSDSLTSYETHISSVSIEAYEEERTDLLNPVVSIRLPKLSIIPSSPPCSLLPPSSCRILIRSGVLGID